MPLLLKTNVPVEPVWFWGLATLVATLIMSLSLVLASRVGLGAPLLEGRLPREDRRRWALRGLALCILMLGVAAPLGLIANLGADPATYPFGWELLGASLKAGVVEEIGYRFFVISLCVWLGGLVKRAADGRPARSVYWAAILIAGLLFGWAHVDARLSIPSVPLWGYVLIMLVNTALGIYFGWLMVILGLEWAMLAHFIYDAFISMVVIPVYLLERPFAWVILTVGLYAVFALSFRYLLRTSIL